MGYAVRTNRYRYVEWRDGKSNQVVARELYDHQVDSQEMRNVAGLAEYTAATQDLAKLLRAGWQSALPGLSVLETGGEP